jgi:hypothetical protein
MPKLLLAVQGLYMVHRNAGLAGNRAPTFATSYRKRNLMMMIAQSPFRCRRGRKPPQPLAGAWPFGISRHH